MDFNDLKKQLVESGMLDRFKKNWCIRTGIYIEDDDVALETLLEYVESIN